MPSRVSRRRDEDEDEQQTEERPSRSRRSRDEDERPSRGSRRSRGSRDEDEEDERPRRGSRRSRDEDEDEDERPSRGSRASRRGGASGSKGRSTRAAGGFDSYRQKKALTSSYADEFKPEDDKPILIKFLDAEPFDNFLQHWVEDAKKGDPKSYMCYDDEYHPDFEEQGCPLCEIGENRKSYSLFNVLDLTNPNKPEVKVWVTSPYVTDTLMRMAEAERTKPLDRIDLYFEVEKVKKGKKTEWSIQPVKARDLSDDFDIEPFTEDEIETFLDKRYDDRKDVTRVDTWERLDEVAEYVS